MCGISMGRRWEGVGSVHLQNFGRQQHFTHAKMHISVSILKRVSGKLLVPGMSV